MKVNLFYLFSGLNFSQKKRYTCLKLKCFKSYLHILTLFVFIKKRTFFFNKYNLTTTKVLPTSHSDISVSELTAMLNKDKQSLNIIFGKAKKVVLLDVKPNQNFYFISLASCAEYFRNLGNKPRVIP
jgi:hypothetical protein